MTHASSLLLLWIVLLGAAQGCAAGSPPAQPVEIARSSIRPVPPVRPVALAQPSPAVAADAARCRGSAEKLEACLEDCSKNDEAACASLMQSCEEGDAIACGYAGGYLETHARVSPVDPARMLRYFDAACSGGVLFGCLRLSGLFAHGESGVTADPARASESVRRAVDLTRTQCERADPHGCMAFGGYAREGWGTAVDPKASQAAFTKAFKLMNAACSTGDGLMCHMLAVYHIDGIGTPVDRTKGQTFLRRACSLPWKSTAASCMMLKQVFGEAPATVALP